MSLKKGRQNIAQKGNFIGETYSIFFPVNYGRSTRYKRIGLESSEHRLYLKSIIKFFVKIVKSLKRHI